MFDHAASKYSAPFSSLRLRSYPKRCHDRSSYGNRRIGLCKGEGVSSSVASKLDCVVASDGSGGDFCGSSHSSHDVYFGKWR